MNRNVLWRNPDKVSTERSARMTAYWGDESWKNAAYTTTQSLFGEPEKESNESVAMAFGQRLQKIAGFKRVPDPLPMRNSKGAIVYYLFFASQVEVAENILKDIFRKYRNRGEA
jgi:three-Cys-motif partner protein